MTVQLSPQPVFQAFAPNGRPLVGGKLSTYIAGTTTPQATYVDSSQTTQNTNPVILNSYGQASVWLVMGQTYKLVLNDAAGNPVWTQDQISGGQVVINMTQALFNAFLGSATYAGASADIANAAIVRNAGYSGGTFGFVNSALRVTDNVTGSGATAFEWAFTSILNNFATAGQNVAGYHQGNKNGNIGPTWASVSEVREILAVNNPATGTVGHEIDVRANGTDSSNNRIGSDVVITKFTGGGAACQAGYAYRVQNAGDGVSNVGFGYGFAPGMIAAIGFDTSNGTMTSGAFQLAQNQAIIFDGPTTQTRKLTYDGVGLTYSVGGVLGARLLPNGVQVGTGKVLGASIGGYGTPTGGSRATLVPGTATLAQVCALVNQVIVDFQTHGALGA